MQAAVEADTEPTTVADVRRDEEAFGIGLDERALQAVWGGTPDGEAPVAVVVVHDHQEGALLAHEERRRTVTASLAGVGESETDLPDPGENLFVGLSDS